MFAPLCFGLLRARAACHVQRPYLHTIHDMAGKLKNREGLSSDGVVVRYIDKSGDMKV